MTATDRKAVHYVASAFYGRTYTSGPARKRLADAKRDICNRKLFPPMKDGTSELDMPEIWVVYSDGSTSKWVG